MQNQGTFRFTVDYGVNLPLLIRAGKYADFDPDIATKHFPKEGGGRKKIKLKLIRLEKMMPANEAEAEFLKTCLRPATLYEVLAFGAKFIEEQCKNPIMALGSSMVNGKGEKGYPYIWAYSNQRFAALYWYGAMLPTNFRFAVVETGNGPHTDA